MQSENLKWYVTEKQLEKWQAAESPSESSLLSASGPLFVLKGQYWNLDNYKL